MNSSFITSGPGSMYQTISIHTGSYMSAHVLFNLLNKLRKRDKMRGLLSILSLICNEFNNSIIQEHEVRFCLSYDIKITLKSHICRKNVIILTLSADYVRSVVMDVITFPEICKTTRLLIDFNAWRYFTPRRDVM